MKLTDIKSALLPHKYCAHKSKSVGTPFLLLLCACLIAFVCVICSVKSFTDGIYDDITDFISSADNFYLSESGFSFIGKEKSCYIKNVDLIVNVDSDADYLNIPENGDRTPLISVFIAGNGINVNFDGLEYSASVAELYTKFGNLDFTKSDVDIYLNSSTNILFNAIFSLLLFILMLAVFILAVSVLLISLLIRLLNRICKCGFDFKQIMFISIGSFIYPILFGGLIFVFSDGILFCAVYGLDILRLFIGAVLLYILFAVYPIFVSVSKTDKTKTKE